jgi:UDP:flavonoid glycosyltransferase YjiC (YdhE family)
MAVLTLNSCGTLGDHFPFLALGRALVRQGHEVRYAGPVYLRGEIEGCGMVFYRVRPELEPGMVQRKPERFDHWSEEKGGFAKGESPEVDLFETLEIENRLHDLIEATRGADLLICSISQSVGKMVSEVLKVPMVTLCVVPWFFPDAETSAARGLAARDAKARTRPATRQFYGALDALRGRLGLPPIPEGRELDHFESRRVLLATSPLFGEPGARPDREIVQTGFWFHERPAWSGWELPAGLEKLLADRPEPLVLAFSSQPVRDPGAVLDTHLGVARKLGKVLVAQAGWAGLDSEPFRDACEAGEAVLFPEGPQDWLFGKAGAVINHGGIGTVARAIRAGVPLLVEPYGNDQFYNARQVVAIGAGAAVNPHRLTVDGMTRVLEGKVLVPEVRARVREMSGQLDGGAALKTGVRQIESWLREDETG